MKRTERLFLERAGKVLTVSDADKDSLSAILDPSRISTIPTGVDTDYFRSSNLPQLPHSIVFVGSMDWMPNEDGILFFMERIFPLVRKTLQCATIKIVGRDPSAKLIRALQQYSQVTLTGRVDDIRPYLDEAEVCIVPLRVGSGTRLKIFEAMSMGKAVVTTTLGAEGLPVTDGNNVLVANTEKDFADAVIRLMQDAGLRSRIGRAARTLVEREYSWRSVGDTFARSVEDFLAHDRPLGAAAD
jgi:glycosyltransferase involved in cell wall biosynthesis